LEEADEDVKDLYNILGIDIDIYVCISTDSTKHFALVAYRLAGSCLLRPCDLFTGSYPLVASVENLVLKDDCDSSSAKSSGTSWTAAAWLDAYRRHVWLDRVIDGRICVVVNCRRADGNSDKAILGIRDLHVDNQMTKSK
jgi:hypothetical protein